MEVFYKTLFVLFGFIIVKNLQISNCIRLNDQELIQSMPLDTQWLMYENFIYVSLKMQQKCVKTGKCQESTGRWEIFTVGSFEVQAVSSLLIKKSSKNSFETSLSEILFEPFDQEGIFEV